MKKVTGKKDGKEVCQNSKNGIPGWLSGLALAFGPGHDPGDLGSSPTSGSLQAACLSL